MKKARRFAAIAAAAMMTAALALPMSMSSFAAEGDPASVTYSITIRDHGNVTASSHTFGAYQIFKFSLEDGKISGVVEWGDSATDAVKSALRSKVGVDETATAEDVMNAMKEYTDDSEQAKAVAAAIGGALTASDNPVATGQGTVDVTTSGSGYYFVKDTAAIGDGDAATRFILEVLGTEDVDIKTDAPTLEKKIWHNDTAPAPTIGKGAPTYTANVGAALDVQDSGWNDVGDNQIGDTVYFMTASSVPDMSDYNAYEYKIHDKMGDGLTFGEVKSVVYMPAGATEGIELTKDVHYAVLTTGISTEDTFVVDFENMKWILGTICGENAAYTGGTIYTYYTATLNENAKISEVANGDQWNENKARLEYSNNPNASGKGFKDENNDDKPDTPDDKGDEEKDEDNNDSETGETEWDFVYDWTFMSNVDKTDDKNKPLAGAVFQLMNGSTPVQLVEVSAPDLKGDPEDGRVYYRPAKTDETGVTEITTNANGKFAFVGLDDKVTYTLHEKTAPNGYSLAGDASLVLTAKYEAVVGEGEDATGHAALANNLTTLSLGMTTQDEQNVSSSDLKVTVIDKKKTFSLPSTGGVGTTLFYVVGGALVAGAGVTLITKKRISDTNK